MPNKVLYKHVRKYFITSIMEAYGDKKRRNYIH